MKIDTKVFILLMIVAMISLSLKYTTLFQTSTISHHKQDVQIQILGKSHDGQNNDTEKDLELIEKSLYDEELSYCPEGDIGCQKNLTFFNNTYYTGILNQDDMNMITIDEDDNDNETM